ncbi:MAG: LysR substrate-binding domain-containing protein [Kiloniellales bacterium]|nr:LysR substrate-binding domain-containing protein [Kiloniellales bacterium]
MRANWRSLRELEALRAVIEAGTATAAARRLGISQPAVSRALAQLETRLGKILFEREGGRLLPTAEALALNRDLEPMFDALLRLDDVGWSITSAEALRLAIPPTLAHRFLHPHIASFLKLHPEQAISLDIRGTDVLVPGIAEQRYHLGITDSEIRHSGVRVEPFLRSEGVCVLPADSPLAGREVIRPRDLRDQPYVALTRRHSSRAATDRVFAEAGVERRIVVETATAVSAYELVRAGLGVAVLNPFPVALRADGAVVIRPFAPRLAYLTAFIVSAAAPLPAAGRAFMRHVRRETTRVPHTELV